MSTRLLVLGEKRNVFNAHTKKKSNSTSWDRTHITSTVASYSELDGTHAHCAWIRCVSIECRIVYVNVPTDVGSNVDAYSSTSTTRYSDGDKTCLLSLIIDGASRAVSCYVNTKPSRLPLLSYLSRESYFKVIIFSKHCKRKNSLLPHIFLLVSLIQIYSFC